MATTSPIFGLPAPELTDGANIEDAVGPLRDRIEVVLNALIPVGFVIADAGSTIPTLEGWVWDWADGDLIDRTTYLAFFTRVGHAYNGNVDPGANKVRKPDRRGRVGVTADNMGPLAAAARLTVAAGHSNARGQGGGEERHQITVTEMAKHRHKIGGQDNQLVNGGGFGANAGLVQTGGAYAVGGLDETGADAPHNNVQPYQVDNALVRIA